VGSERIKGWGMVLCLLLLSACGDIGGSGQCGGTSETGSCLRIESIVPEFDGKETPNVDSQQDICNLSEVSATTTAQFEIFKDHAAKLTVSNRPMPGVLVTDMTDITLEQYAITYKVNRCPPGASCPPNLTPLKVAPGQTVVIPANGTVTFTLPFFPIAAVQDYKNQGGSHVDYPSYSATYTLIGTDSFKNPVSVVGSAEFTIGNFDRCSGTGT